MTVWNMLNNPATTLIFIASIGFAAILIGIRNLLDLRDMPRAESNVGSEE